jgi:transposase
MTRYTISFWRRFSGILGASGHQGAAHESRSHGVCSTRRTVAPARFRDAATIAMLYRKRWRIELFFKWIKQHLHIKAFFGTSPNAVKTQMWVAVLVYLLVVKLKHHYQLPQDLNEIVKILSVTILEKTPVFELFSHHQIPTQRHDDHNQLSLFNF